MRFTDLPPEIRVKLDEQQEEQLWRKVDEFGISEAAAETGYSCASIYNWRNKDSFLPVEFVKPFLEVGHVKALKGGGRSKPIRDLKFPIDFPDELITRVNVSVKVNREGVPIYQTQERSLLDRFAQLLDSLDASYSVYNRSVFELRYPKYLHSMFEQESYSTDFAALVDEKGVVGDGKLKAEEKSVRVDDFEDELFHRDKKLELALARQDSEEVEKILSEESSRIQDLFNG